MGRGRRGPGLVGTAARTAVIAGTATAVSGRVATAQAVRQAPAGPAPAHAPLPPAPPPVPGGVPGAAVAPEQPPRPSVDELHRALTQLGELRDAGLLTDDELAVQKARLLGT